MLAGRNPVRRWALGFPALDLKKAPDLANFWPFFYVADEVFFSVADATKDDLLGMDRYWEVTRDIPKKSSHRHLAMLAEEF